jgi:hypothetical protein
MEIHCTWLFLWSKDFGTFQNMISLGSHNTRHPIRVDGDGPCYSYATTARKAVLPTILSFQATCTCIYMHRYVRREITNPQRKAYTYVCAHDLHDLINRY